MSSTEDDNKKNKVVPFGAKKTKTEVKDEEKKINWSSEAESEKEFNKLTFLIEAHADNILELMAEYFRENHLFDPEKMSVQEYKDMILIKEAIVAMFARRVGMSHELHSFIDQNMDIPLPDNN